ncbi:MAG: hypothetical protein A3J40_13445 [Erythrobacter sp. RIFCSPHIGHO2_12_FULL_63_10]|nr:MAG: hypothetical protein A3J40_13445 [Erythrobacter sp. RIFCSPHIGHO2_12_FULL_63_10]
MALGPGNKKPEADKQAQRQIAQDEVLMREIDEAVRQDDMAQFLSAYGKPLLGLVIAGILAFGGYLLWQSREEAAMEAQSEKLVAALDKLQAGDTLQAQQLAASLAAKGDGAAAASAQMMQAGLAMEQGKRAEAAAIFAKISADDNAPPAIRDLATIREVTATFDTRKPADVIARLKPLAVPGNPWFGSAGELVAMAHLELGQREQAGTLFGEIAKSDDVPETIRARARQMAGLLGVDAIEDVEALLESQGVPTANTEGAASAQ